ncbi:hypothetical protein JMJ55_27070 [Belnapia sp. T6]|uniref:BioF2-like acetyltransferase domain-containing protein n=1 Tax=Belnapia mucosa TaxID=2804532 RepID=A0ABS1VBG8_9PROT|nr:hypothetical protein [Belnapia mucosa]MBL6458997.1 hypothetical protein [Belnapia mucosa]
MPAEWDAFALRCEASYRCLSGWITIWQIQHQLAFRVRRFECFRNVEGAWVKIGQCALGMGWKSRIFADGLQLLPEQQGAWSACMEELLRRLGRGRYLYGSDWSVEPPREEQIGRLPGTVVTNVSRHIVEGVHFSRWDNWDSYERSVSANVRRNVKRAVSIHKSADMAKKVGLAALLGSDHLLRCKAAMYQRKAVRVPKARIVAGHVLRSLAVPDYAFCAVLREGSNTLAALGGLEIGRLAYYFDGGSAQADGTGWLLKMAIMKGFQARHPTGRFLMGTSRVTSELTEGWTSAVRYRRDARVSGFPTSVVRFSYFG